MPRKKGTKLLTTDELTIARNAAAAQAEVFIRRRPQALTIERWGYWAIIAESAAARAKAADMLGQRTFEQAQAIILYGLERGIPPMRALTGIFLAANDHGEMDFVMDSALVRQFVLESGLGMIEPQMEACDDEKAIVMATRRDNFGLRTQMFKYTIQAAERDGRLMLPNWRSGAYRQGLLIGCATMIAKRAMFEDVGCPDYSPDEIGGVGAIMPAPEHGAPGVSGVDSPQNTNQAPAEQTPTPPPPVPPVPPAADGAGQATSPPAGGAGALQPTHPPANATRAEKATFYYETAKLCGRPCERQIAMTPPRNGEPPIALLSHGCTLAQVTAISDQTDAKRERVSAGFAETAWDAVREYLGKCDIDTELLPRPYCYFVLTEQEAAAVLEGLKVLAEQVAAQASNPAMPSEAPPPVKAPSEYTWQEAEALMNSILAKRGIQVAQARGLIKMHTKKEYFENSPQELVEAVAALDRLADNPAALANAMQRMLEENRAGA